VGKASNDLKTSPKPPNSREALPMNPTVNSASTNRNEDPVSSNLQVGKCSWQMNMESLKLENYKLNQKKNN